MRLFEAVPDRLFSVLASPLRQVYADVLLKLYDTFEAHRFGIPREVLLDALTETLEDAAPSAAAAPTSIPAAAAPTSAPALAAATISAASPSYLSAPDDAAPDPFLAALTARDKAAAVVRTLKDTGWIELETHTNYQQYVTLPDYAITLLEALKHVSSPRQVEYRGFVYATYAALSVQEVERDGHLALATAYHQTQLLVRELKSLNNNIRRYTEQLMAHKRPQDILSAHFQGYQAQILDRSYHQLKTSDNVSKYRPRILARVGEWLRDPHWVQAVARAAVRDQQAARLEEAVQTAQVQLRFIESAYQGMDELLEEIDRRNAQYARASLEQVRYLLNSSEDTEGQLKRLLLVIAQRVGQGDLDRKEAAQALESRMPDLEGAWSELFALFTIAFLGDDSLYTPRRPRQPHRAQLLAAAPVDEAARRKSAVRLKLQLSRRMTPQKVHEYVLQQLGERAALRASELPLDAVEDFVRLIYIDAYGEQRRSPYRVTRSRERARQGAFDFPDFSIRRS